MTDLELRSEGLSLLLSPLIRTFYLASFSEIRRS